MAKAVEARRLVAGGVPPEQVGVVLENEDVRGPVLVGLGYCKCVCFLVGGYGHVGDVDATGAVLGGCRGDSNLSEVAVRCVEFEESDLLRNRAENFSVRTKDILNDWWIW
jgi:hypothetical protein